MDRSITFFLSVAASMVGYYSLTVRSASSKAKKEHPRSGCSEGVLVHHERIAITFLGYF